MVTKNIEARDSELPEHLAQRPRRVRDWPLPTAWLLGTKLLGSLRDIILSSVVKVDLRTWMTAGKVIDLTKAKREGEACCYIDFLADTGDSQRLVFQMARLLMRENLEVKAWRDGAEVKEALPRGSVLIMGGDIAYPIATHRRLLERVRAPFKWAHDELDAAERKRLLEAPVTLLAVPGNHDYYDGLRGFEALVHSPPLPTLTRSSIEKPPAEQPLRLPGYQLAQHASYFAAALPFGWRVWGLDIENAEIDDRQAAFFDYAKGFEPGVPQADADITTATPPKPVPAQLIVVTSRPAFVYQGRSDHADVIEKSMVRLGVKPAFAEQGQLPANQVRLDLSGDVHLYERYWGTDHPEMPDDVDRVDILETERRYPDEMDDYEPPERYGNVATSTKAKRATRRKRGNDASEPQAPKDCSNYASVVSGLGGTFHHPSQVRMGKTPPRATWPSAEHSAREIGVRLADPWQMFRAGAVGIVGLVLALASYFLIWESETNVNVLDVPFFLSALSKEQIATLYQLGDVAAMVGIVAAMVALPIVAYYLGRFLSTPIREMRRPSTAMFCGGDRPGIVRRSIAGIACGWLSLTRLLSHRGLLHLVLRAFGANARSSWMFITNIPPLGGTLVGWWFLYGLLREQPSVKSNGLLAVYTMITLLVVGMGALGALRAGQKTPLEGWPKNIVRRLILLAFGVLIALLVLWTPYAWVRLICRNTPFVGIVVVAITLTVTVRLGRTIFRRALWARRVATLFAFAFLAALAVGLPLKYAHMEQGEATIVHPWFSMGAAMLLGAYFASLWVGWYFCICLQWNAHGNEAGGAARITQYGEFLRIKLTENQAEVWAIAVEEALDAKRRWYHKLFRRKPRDVNAKPSARLIDHFIVKR
jgi:hypothetical protein